MASEEEEKPIEIDLADQGKYVVCFDPLDGSSNIDANVSIGSIFGIWRKVTKDEDGGANVQDLLQDGRALIAAGYCLYGSSTHFVLSTGSQVNGYTLDPSLGEFLLTHPDIRIPKKGNIYSINEGNSMFWDETVKEYIGAKKFPQDGTTPFSLRYFKILLRKKKKRRLIDWLVDSNSIFNNQIYLRIATTLIKYLLNNFFCILKMQIHWIDGC